MTLVHPLQAEPTVGDGSGIDVAAGLKWLRMPLDGPLQFINVWAARNPGGWTIVDTGVAGDATKSAWMSARTQWMGPERISRVIATHMHPDHCGLAGWMSDTFGAALWMSELEYLTCRVLTSDTGKPPPRAALDFYRAAGWGERDLGRYEERFGFFGRSISPMPSSFTRLSEGDILTLGESEWQVVIGTGHSPGHVCLYCPERRLFIAGDQVLPRISPNVSVHPMEPKADPLSGWMDSLRRLETVVSDDVLVLPAHNRPFRGLHERIRELIDLHTRNLETLDAWLAEPRRTVDLFAALFSRPITPELMMMATGEALAHVRLLEKQGRIVAEPDSSGVTWYRRR